MLQLSDPASWSDFYVSETIKVLIRINKTKGVLEAFGGEQPEEAIYSFPGAMRGGVPLS